MSSSTKSAKRRTPHKHISIEAVKVLFGTRVIAFRPEFAFLGIGTPDGPLGAKGALILSQAFFWAQSNDADENGWFAKTQKEIFAVTGLSDEEQKTAREELSRRGYLAEDTFGREVTDKDGRRTRAGGRLHFKLGLDAIHAHLEVLVTSFSSWLSTGDTDEEQAAIRRDQRNKRDRLKRAETKRKLAETASRVSEIDGYALTEGSTGKMGEMRIPETRKRVAENPTDTQPEPTEYILIEDLKEVKGREQQQHARAISRKADADARSSSMKKAATPPTAHPTLKLTTEQQTAAQQLVDFGVWAEDAAQLAAEFSPVEIADQIAWYPAKAAAAEKAGKPFRSSGAMIAFFIRKRDPKPQVLVNADKAQAAREKAKLDAAQSQQKREEQERAERERLEAERLERERLDAQWEALDDNDKAALDEAIAHTGNVGAVFGGRASQAAQMALRREQLRAGWQPPAPLEGPRFLDRDTPTGELQQAFDELSQAKRDGIEERIRANFQTLGVKAGPTSPTWATQRIALMRRMLDAGELRILAKTDDVWANVSGAMRDAIEAEARFRLGATAESKDALQAMRRALLAQVASGQPLEAGRADAIQHDQAQETA